MASFKMKIDRNLESGGDISIITFTASSGLDQVWLAGIENTVEFLNKRDDVESVKVIDYDTSFMKFEVVSCFPSVMYDELEAFVNN
jgi:hypothetical protein